MTDRSHLSALEVRLSHERERLARAKTDYERKLRTVWVAGIEREIERERDFLGIGASEPLGMSDDEILAALSE